MPAGNSVFPWNMWSDCASSSPSVKETPWGFSLGVADEPPSGDSVCPRTLCRPPTGRFRPQSFPLRVFWRFTRSTPFAARAEAYGRPRTQDPVLGEQLGQQSWLCRTDLLARMVSAAGAFPGQSGVPACSARLGWQCGCAHSHAGVCVALAWSLSRTFCSSLISFIYLYTYLFI